MKNSVIAQEHSRVKKGSELATVSQDEPRKIFIVVLYCLAEVYE